MSCWARKRPWQKLHGHMAQRSSTPMMWINVTCFGGLHFMHMTKVSHGIWRFLWLRWMWTPPTSRDGTGSKTLVKLNLVSKQLRQTSDWKKDCVTISHNIIFQIMHPNTSNDIDGMCLPPTRDLMAPNFEKYIDHLVEGCICSDLSLKEQFFSKATKDGRQIKGHLAEKSPCLRRQSFGGMQSC